MFFFGEIEMTLTFENSEGICNLCGGTHSIWDDEKCEENRFPKAHKQKLEARNASFLANQAAKKRGSSGPIRL